MAQGKATTRGTGHAHRHVTFLDALGEFAWNILASELYSSETCMMRDPGPEDGASARACSGRINRV